MIAVILQHRIQRRGPSVAIPKRHELQMPILKVLEDGAIRSNKEIEDKVAAALNLSDNDRAELLQNKTEPAYGYNLRWGLSDLKKGGLIESHGRGNYAITQKGKEKLLGSGKTNGTEDVTPPQPLLPSVGPVESPRKTLERVYGEMNDLLADELLTEIMKQTPEFFERLVMELMEAMGYGVGEERLKHSNDGGIDGIIHEDELGFDLIYIQAKRWDRSKSIGRPEIQSFAGAMMGPPSVSKGLFITTAKFSQGAQKFAQDQHIILVDGRHLAQLMIEYGVGVSEQKVYKIKRIDGDYFNPEQ